jgi:hypothetical protein
VKSNALPYSQQQLFSLSLTCLGVTLYSATAAAQSGEFSVNTFEDPPLAESLESNGVPSSGEEGEKVSEGKIAATTSLFAAVWRRLQGLFTL